MTSIVFGEGIARGTVPLEHGDGVNALIDFLGPAQDPKPPASRGVENLGAMQQSWNKVEVREAKLEADPAPRLEDSSGFAMREAIAKLRLTSSQVQCSGSL